MDALQAVLDNRYFVATVAVVLACYARFAAPTLSPSALKVVTSEWFQVILIFIVAYLPRKNFQLALAISVGFVMTSHFMVQYKVFEHFQNEGCKAVVQGFEDQHKKRVH